MNSPSIQVQIVENGVSIPVKYLSNAYDFEFERINGNVIVRPKPKSDDVVHKPKDLQKSWLSDLIGIAETRDPTASSRVEEILMDEVNHRSGFTFKPPLDENTL